MVCIARAPWLLQGKAGLKLSIANRVRFDPKSIPYRTDVLEYLRVQRAEGRTIVLATAAKEVTASAIAAHVGLFAAVIASTASVNLKGIHKRDALVQRFGIHGFDYIGDSRADVPVWTASRVAHAAGRIGAVPRAALTEGAAEGRAFSAGKPIFATWMRLIRVHQWVKNFLVFTPALLNHHVNWMILKNLAVTFMGFSLVASGAYIANDLFDLESDRQHVHKKRRPLAAGDIPIATGLILAVLLMLGGLLFGESIGPVVVLCLLFYLALTMMYSAFLKRKPVLDVVCLALLYTVRLYTGGLVSAAYVSPWLFQFSIFLFLSLAFVKRYSELQRLRYQRKYDAPGRGYRLHDLSIISQAGVGTGLIAGLVLALYLNAPEVQLPITILT